METLSPKSDRKSQVTVHVQVGEARVLLPRGVVGSRTGVWDEKSKAGMICRQRSGWVSCLALLHQKGPMTTRSNYAPSPIVVDRLQPCVRPTFLPSSSPLLQPLAPLHLLLLSPLPSSLTLALPPSTSSLAACLGAHHLPSPALVFPQIDGALPAPFRNALVGNA